MSQVTEQSVRFQTALASIKLIQASAVLDLTEDDFDFLTSNKVWIATDRKWKSSWVKSKKIGRAVQQKCRDRTRMPSSAPKKKRTQHITTAQQDHSPREASRQPP